MTLEFVKLLNGTLLSAQNYSSQGVKLQNYIQNLKCKIVQTSFAKHSSRD